MAGDHECLSFTIRASAAIAQYQAYRISAILQISRREKARLPDVFVSEVPQRLYQAERKQRDHGNNGAIGLYSNHRIARTNHPRTQQRSWHGEKRGVRSNELVLARETDDLIHCSRVLAVALDLGQQGIDASACPQARDLWMFGRLRR